MKALSVALVTAALFVAHGAHAAAPWAEGGPSQAQDLEVSLLTFSPGDDIPSWWGHTALLVRDKRLGFERLYNYGMFSFDDTMVARFVMGRLDFWVSEDAPTLVIRHYARENRDVRAQHLALTPEQALAAARALSVNVLPENRTYLYDHFLDNCSTRPRDIIDQAVGGQFKAAMGRPARLTIREHVRRFTAPSAALSVAIDFLLTDKIDKKIKVWDEQFLPDELENGLDALTLKNDGGLERPAVRKKEILYQSSRPPPVRDGPNYTPFLLCLGLFLGGAAVALVWFGRERRAARVTLGLENALVGLVFGIPGLVGFLLWMFTDHASTYRNENLFWANPLTLALVPLGILDAWGARTAPRLLRGLWTVLLALTVLGLVMKLFPVFDQNVWRLAALMVPVNFGLAAAQLLRARQRRPAPVGVGKPAPVV